MDASEEDDRKPLPRSHSTNHPTMESNRNPSFPITRNRNHVKYEFDHQKTRKEDEQESAEFADDEEEAAEDEYSFLSRMRHKKQKMGNSDHNFSFVSGNASNFGRTSPLNWTEYFDSVLLETWGERFLQLGKTDLGSDGWWEVAEKVSEACKIGFTRAQCRSRLDELKKKFKREKMKVEAVGGGRSTSKWPFFEKMEVLFGSCLSQHCSLPCGIDSGNYAFMDSNGLDEMRDSATESDDGGGEPETGGVKGMDNEGLWVKSLADSVLKLGNLYKKVESRKSRQMMELEKMRMDFTIELEKQKKQLLENAMEEIAKQQEDDSN